MLGEIVRPGEEWRRHADDGEHMVLLDQLLGDAEINRRAPLVVLLIGQLELAPGHTPWLLTIEK